MTLEQKLNRAWYGKPGLLRLLLPLEGLYRGVAAARRQLIRGHSCGAPVIVVGNISVGGSGKTPVVLALAEYCQAQGFRVGIVSRGYGGRAPEYPYLLNSNSGPAEAGDEPYLMAKRSGLPVAVAPDRLAAAQLLVSQSGCNLIISDDGLQHYRLARDIEVLVIDGERGFGNSHCLPVGPLREPRSRARDIALRIINGGDTQNNSGLSGHAMRLKGTVAVNLATGEQRALADWPAAERRVHGLAGIGSPQRFFRSLRAAGFDVVEHAFPDHYPYAAADLQFTEALPVLMTEKDAVKCRYFSLDQHWMLPVNGVIDDEFYKKLQSCLAEIKTKR
ncbi:MAG: tetraacyldisaccharide 4'-kinase [Zhongshania sp.]|uniref:tetraacyldisaccharide 4'-kinase n=1 Tax=Zhongshania sp. TaxID=1971902 RepID=UPI00261F751A|nr:tetraacyldisaccharide 4'-kinase [Zhongshania sp.]MDF1691127.1 tetraacyldisaccharide 4'-kinase [Zhongshania sp.]